MRKVTVKAVLWKYKTNRMGHSPIYIKITADRKTTYLATGHYIPSKLWDEKSEMVKMGHPLAREINSDIMVKRKGVLEEVLKSQVQGSRITAGLVKSRIRGSNYFEFVDQFIREVSHKRQPGTLENYRKHTKKLEEYQGNRELKFEEITVEYLREYEKELRKSVGENYVHALWKTMKMIFNAARKMKITDHYPFSEYENPRYRAPGKNYLSLEEIRLMEKDLMNTGRGSTYRQTMVYFLLGCYTGLRISDWYGFRTEVHIADGWVKLRAKKNGEYVSVPVSGMMERLIPYLEEDRLVVAEQEINRSLKDICKRLGIRKQITSHCARHTFAITLCSEMGVSSESCAELMGITIKTCVENYYKVTSRKIRMETMAAWEGL